MKKYTAMRFDGPPDWSKVPTGEISTYHWEPNPRYRPKTFFQLCIVKNRGFILHMLTRENFIRATYENRDDPVYQDSCMEFFFNPFPESGKYINLEINPNGAYLCEIGAGKGCRTFVKELTEETVEIETLQMGKRGWKLSAFISKDFIESLYHRDFDSMESEFRANFYKCGDLTKTPHYGAFSPVTTLPPGFHNPDMFAKIIIKDA